MAKPWAEVEGSEAYQALPPVERELARRQYFVDVVAPRVPQEKLNDVFSQFNKETQKVFQENPEADTIARMEMPGVMQRGLSEIGQVAASKFGPLLTDDPQTRANIILKNLPGSKLVEDRLGVPMIEYNGQRFYLSKKGGIDETDVARGIVGAGVALPAAAGAGVLTAGAGLGVTAFGQGLAAMGSSVIEDTLANLAGGKNQIDPVKAAVSGGLGAGATLLAPVVKPVIGRGAEIISRMTGRGRLIDDAGNLTKTGQSVFAQAGLDPTAYTAQQLRQIETQVLRGVGDDAAQVAQQGAAKVRGDEMGIPRTGGQQTLDASQLRFEDRARYGSFGGEPQQRMQAFGAQQREAFDTSVAGAREAMTGAPADAGQTMLNEFTTAKQTARAGVRSAYDALDLTKAAVQDDVMRELPGRVYNRLNPDFDLRSTTEFGSTNHYLDRLRQMAGNPYTPLAEFEQWRRQLGSSIRGAGNGSDRAALIQMRNEADDWLRQVQQRGRVLGDPAEVSKLRAATDKAGDYVATFSNARTAPSAVNQMLRMADKEGVTGADFAKQVFGAKGTKLGMEASLDHLTQVFGGPGSAGHQAMREAWLQQVIPTDKGYQAIASSLNKALRGEQAHITDKLFNTTERAMLGRLRDEAALLAKTTNRQNASGTSYALESGALSDGMKRILGGVLGFSAEAIFPGSGTAGAVAGAAFGKKAGEAVQGVTRGMAVNRSIAGGAPYSQQPLSSLLPPALGVAGQSQKEEGAGAVRGFLGLKQR